MAHQVSIAFILVLLRALVAHMVELFRLSEILTHSLRLKDSSDKHCTWPLPKAVLHHLHLLPNTQTRNGILKTHAHLSAAAKSGICAVHSKGT